MDIGDLIRIGVVLFIVYNLLFGKKQTEKKEEYQYPTFPEDEQPEPHKQEEKLRQWLEETFGGKPKTQPEPLPTQAQYIEQVEETIELEPQVFYQSPVAKVQHTQPLKLGKIGKTKLAHAMLMKEILDKPISKRHMNYYR